MNSILDFINERPVLFFRWVIIFLAVASVSMVVVTKRMIDKRPNKSYNFEVVQAESYFTIENQNGKFEVASEEDLYEYIEAVFKDENQFAVLTAPKAIHGVRCVQACLTNGKVEVQVAAESDNRTNLYFKMCSSNEALDIFKCFFNGHFVLDMAQYKPVAFY